MMVLLRHEYLCTGRTERQAGVFVTGNGGCLANFKAKYIWADVD